MSITYDLIRGHTDAIILGRLKKGDSYGYQINKDILSITQNQLELKEATLYSAFRRLEQTGMIMSYWGNEEVGARRRYYCITKAGELAYQEYLQDWGHTKGIIDSLLDE
ncbi:MAG: PadR family transcriptional regulator [Oscillospiraceae bacterium]